MTKLNCILFLAMLTMGSTGSVFARPALRYKVDTRVDACKATDADSDELSEETKYLAENLSQGTVSTTATYTK